MSDEAKAWRIEHDNDTGKSDESFTEWWDVTDGERSFRAWIEEDAKRLCDLLNRDARPPESAIAAAREISLMLADAVKRNTGNCGGVFHGVSISDTARPIAALVTHLEKKAAAIDWIETNNANVEHDNPTGFVWNVHTPSGIDEGGETLMEALGNARQTEKELAADP